MTGSQSTRLKPLKIGDITLANRVLLAPMSGITDAPFRRLAATLGAGLVVSEMTASNDLVNGRPMSRLRCEATGIGTHVVQLAGCETDNEMLRSTATSPMFPPAPANALNAPGIQASGAGYH